MRRSVAARFSVAECLPAAACSSRAFFAALLRDAEADFVRVLADEVRAFGEDPRAGWALCVDFSALVVRRDLLACAAGRFRLAEDVLCFAFMESQRIWRGDSQPYLLAGTGQLKGRQGKSGKCISLAPVSQVHLHAHTDAPITSIDRPFCS